MKRLLLLTFAILLVSFVGARGQFGSFGDVPVVIDADETGWDRNLGLATATGNVIIRYNEVTMYSDYASYNPDTRDVLVSGNVRLYREGNLFTGERAVYNLETKQLTAADFRGSFTPFSFAGDTLSTLGSDAYFVRNGIFTTSDNSKPDYFLRSKTIRIYPNDRVIFSNVKLYIGRTPVMWFPYIYQSLNEEQSFSLAPGYSSTFDAYLLTRYTFPISQNLSGTLRLDLLSKRGVGIGFDSDWNDPKSTQKEWGRFRSYYINDAAPGTDRTRTGVAREPIDPSRYRVSLQDRTYLTEDIYSSIDINKLSDARFLEDFEPGVFRKNPNPDNSITLTKWDEDYTVTLLGRAQLNEFFDFTERLPELALDLKRRPIFGSGIFYEGESSAGYLSRNFAENSLFQDYDTFRADTFHQFLYPKTYMGWLSVIPRVGLRGTYYADSGFFEEDLTTREVTLADGSTVTTTDTEYGLRENSSLFRPVINAGVEASFKVSRAYEGVQSRKWGLDGLRHVVQPYMNFSYVWSGEDPYDILQFDRINPSTQPPPIDFPQFNSIDAINNWTVLRLGTRNRFQTRRDNATFSWLEWNTFVDINIDRPDFPASISSSRSTRREAPDSTVGGLVGSAITDGGTFSNIHNRIRWIPLPWVSLTLDSQLPLLDEGFTELNSNVNFVLTRNLQMNLGHRYIEGNPLFLDSSLVTIGGYLRVGDNWGFSFREQFEFDTSTLESQRYEVHRDLSSWIASMGVLVRDNNGVQDIGVVLTFTLKDLPSLRLPLALDPEGLGGDGSGSSKSQ